MSEKETTMTETGGRSGHGEAERPGHGGPDAAPAPGGGSPGGRRWWVVVLGLLAVVGVGYVVRTRSQAAAGGAGKDAATAPPADRPVPVVATTVEQRDVPVYLEGIGSVAAFNTVAIKAQVDGRLDKVFFREGQAVKKGELLAQVDARPFAIQLQSAQAGLTRDRVQVDNARVNLKRYEDLRAQNLIPQQQVDDQKATVRQLEAVTLLDQAQISSARLSLDYSRVISPIDGVTGVRLVDAGNFVRATDPNGIVVVTQLDPISILFTLPEDDLPRVARSLAEGPVTVEAWSRDGARKLAAGQVLLIDNQINQATATIRLKASFPNTDRSLWPNQFVKARLLLAVRKGALVVPATVVQRGPQGTFAYAIGDDQKVAMKPITVESFVADLAILSAGLRPGEKVVSEGQGQLRPGSKISTKSDKPGPAGSGSGRAPGGGPPGQAP
jgi:multidrug efflux system membrane fusion protein